VAELESSTQITEQGDELQMGRESIVLHPA
jgi:hypothetical protein